MDAGVGCVISCLLTCSTTAPQSDHPCTTSSSQRCHLHKERIGFSAERLMKDSGSLCVNAPSWFCTCVCTSVAGSGAGLLLWSGGALHLGCGDSCSWSELHHDWNILWTVCHGGQWRETHTHTHFAQTVENSVSLTLVSGHSFFFLPHRIVVCLHIETS